jgi:hypothetical protein
MTSIQAKKPTTVVKELIIFFEEVFNKSVRLCIDNKGP